MPTVKGYVLEGDWSISSTGSTALATKGGKKYFLKRYGACRKPKDSPSLSAAGKERQMKKFNKFRDNRIRINNSLREVAGPGGNIILPIDWFIDDVYFIEATEFVENLLSDEQIIALPFEDKLFTALTAAAAMRNIHDRGIVHSDLKRSNILAMRHNNGGKINYPAKIIDFDFSYFTDNIMPDYIGGDQQFMSPEFTLCLQTDMSPDFLKYLSAKSDIFSLGLVFHDYFADGKHPEIVGLSGRLKEKADEGLNVYCGEAMLGGAKLKISSKIREPYLQSIIAAMLQLEPDDRPTAREVLEALRGRRPLEVKSDSVILSLAGGSRSTPSPAPSPAPTPTPSPAPAIPEGFCEPWEEDGITFDEDALKRDGYVACERFVSAMSRTRSYKFYLRDGGFRILSAQNLKLLDYASAGARKKTTAADTGKKAPVTESVEYKSLGAGLSAEDLENYELNAESFGSGGYTGVERIERDGKQYYTLVKEDGSKLGCFSIQKLALSGFVKKKRI